MFRQFLKQAARASPRGRVGRSVLLTSGFAVAGTGVALAHSGPEKIGPADVQSGVVSLSDRDFDPPSPEVLDEERAAAQQGGQSAYDPVTGEINWDCPCLGGMAHGPCGPEFKEAFACFIYSKEEIKGSECIPKFSAMQNCFRQYPDVYADFQEDTQTVGAAGAADAKAADAKAADAVADAKDAAKDTKDAVVAKTGELKDAAHSEVTEAKRAGVAKLDKAKQAGSAKLDETKDQVEQYKADAAAKLGDAEDTASSKAKEYADAAAAALEQAKQASADKTAEVKEAVSAQSSTWADSLSGAAEEAVQQSTAAWDDAAARLKNLTNQAQEIASAKASNLASRVSDTDQNLTTVLSDYTSRVQQAAKEVVEEASSTTEQLNASDISELIEQKLNEAHKDAAELFANTTASQPVNNAATFASDAVQGIAAEAKEAVHLVAKGVNDTFGTNK